MGRVAYFVSPHGFGHAARACAVMAEMRRRCRDIHFDIFTEVPRWFFAESLPGDFTYHPLASDIGLVQRSPLIEDLEATVDRLDAAPHRDGEKIRELADRLRRLGSSIVIVDVSPLGLAAAAAASLPSVLVENFTWDWIYLNYPNSPSRLQRHGHRMAEVFAAADLRIQTEPVCELLATAVQVPPVARSPGIERSVVRKRLGVPVDASMIVVSMGGVPWDYGGFLNFEHTSGPWIVVPGGSERIARRRDRLLLLPFHADVYHPDLVAASDAVVSKLGYSTVAETYRAGSAFAYLKRPHFPESPVLARWVEQRMAATEITEEAMSDGAWLADVDKLLKKSRRKPDELNGAVQVAEIILERFGSVLG